MCIYFIGEEMWMSTPQVEQEEGLEPLQKQEPKQE